MSFLMQRCPTLPRGWRFSRCDRATSGPPRATAARTRPRMRRRFASGGHVSLTRTSESRPARRAAGCSCLISTWTRARARTAWTRCMIGRASTASCLRQSAARRAAAACTCCTVQNVWLRTARILQPVWTFAARAVTSWPRRASIPAARCTPG